MLFFSNTATPTSRAGTAGSLAQPKAARTGRISLSKTPFG
jgi:hypothetical protein